MSLRKAAVFAALCAVALMGIASSASAATFLRSDPNGTLLPSGTKIHATLKAGTHATLTSTSGTITCSSSTFTADAGASGGATVPYTLTQLTFTNCSDDVALVNFSSCHLASNYVGSITSTGTGGTLSVGGMAVTCFHNIGSCTFTSNASQNGVGTNSSNQIAFTNIGAAGSGFGCPSTGSFSATYNPVVVEGTTNTVTITQS